MKKFCEVLKRLQQKYLTMRKRKRCHWKISRLNLTILENSVISAKRSFMKLVIAVILIGTVIPMVRNLMPESFMVMLQDLMILIITMIMMMIVMMKDLMLESFIEMPQDLMMLMIMIMMINLMSKCFMVML